LLLREAPHPDARQAMVLGFSVPAGVRPPPSLQNIHSELETDLGLPRPTTGDLTPWAERGVLLLNAVSRLVDTRRRELLCPSFVQHGVGPRWRSASLDSSGGIVSLLDSGDNHQ